jgi:hypothetical protein
VTSFPSKGPGSPAVVFAALAAAGFADYGAVVVAAAAADFEQNCREQSVVWSILAWGNSLGC